MGRMERVGLGLMWRMEAVGLTGLLGLLPLAGMMGRMGVALATGGFGLLSWCGRLTGWRKQSGSCSGMWW